MKSKKDRRIMKSLVYLFVILFLFSSNVVWAFDSNFSQGDVGYELYDLVFNKGLNGPIGWVVVFSLVVLGLVQLAKGAAMPCFMAIGAGVLIKAAPAILSSFGLTLEYAYVSGVLL